MFGSGKIDSNGRVGVGNSSHPSADGRGEASLFSPPLPLQPSPSLAERAIIPDANLGLEIQSVATSILPRGEARSSAPPLSEFRSLSDRSLYNSYLEALQGQSESLPLLIQLLQERKVIPKEGFPIVKSTAVERKEVVVQGSSGGILVTNARAEDMELLRKFSKPSEEETYLVPQEDGTFFTYQSPTFSQAQVQALLLQFGYNDTTVSRVETVKITQGDKSGTLILCVQNSELSRADRNKQRANLLEKLHEMAPLWNCEGVYLFNRTDTKMFFKNRKAKPKRMEIFVLPHKRVEAAPDVSLALILSQTTEELQTAYHQYEALIAGQHSATDSQRGLPVADYLEEMRAIDAELRKREVVLPQPIEHYELLVRDIENKELLRSMGIHTALVDNSFKVESRALVARKRTLPVGTYEFVSGGSNLDYYEPKHPLLDLHVLSNSKFANSAYTVSEVSQKQKLTLDGKEYPCTLLMLKKAPPESPPKEIDLSSIPLVGSWLQKYKPPSRYTCRESVENSRVKIVTYLQQKLENWCCHSVRLLSEEENSSLLKMPSETAEEWDVFVIFHKLYQEEDTTCQ